MTIASEIIRLQNAKSSIATSIWNKWVTVPAATKLDWYPALIDQIDVRNARMSHLVTPTSTFLCYYTPYSYSTPLSWEYNWTAYWVSAFHYYTGSDSFRFYEGILTCKITPTTWIAWATLGSSSSYTGSMQNSTDTPVAWSVWRNADSSDVKVFIFIDQRPSSSYPQLNSSYCFGYDWNTTTNVVNYYNCIRWDRYDYNPTNYWYDLTWYTQVTSSSWASNVSLSRSSSTASYFFYIKD